MSESTEPMGDPDVSDLAASLADRMESMLDAYDVEHKIARGMIEFEFRSVIAEWVAAQ